MAIHHPCVSEAASPSLDSGKLTRETTTHSKSFRPQGHNGSGYDLLLSDDDNVLALLALALAPSLLAAENLGA